MDNRTAVLLDKLTETPQQLPVGNLEMRQLYEHMRRQVIEDLRFYDLMLYGDKGHTIPERKR